MVNKIEELKCFGHQNRESKDFRRIASAYALRYALGNQGVPMDNTNSRTFRTKLSEFFDLATKNPVAIARGSDRFVLMNEEEYLNLKDEVLSLQRNLISMLDVRSGKFETIAKPEDLSEMFDNISAKVKKKHKAKKAAGE